MNGRAFLVWQRMVGPNAPTKGLRVLKRLAKSNHPFLVRGEWGDDERGCILQHLGRNHSKCQGKEPGYSFAFLFGGFQIVQAWDAEDLSRDELIRLVTLELRARKAARKEVAQCSS